MMGPAELRAAVDAALTSAAAVGLAAEDAIVLQNSNRLMLRLTPCDVVARVAQAAYRESAEFEVEVARRLAGAGSPVAALDPRLRPAVQVQAGFVINFWTYYEAHGAGEFGPQEYARVLQLLHAGMRQVDLPAPRFTDRVAEAQQLVEDPDLTPDLAADDRELLGSTLRRLLDSVTAWGAVEQLLHGEPHAGNLLPTADGPRFIDFETCCVGPVEFDIAHAPEPVGEHYPGIDRMLLHECRSLVRAMVAAWRWDRNDQFPDGRRMGRELLDEIRAAG